MRNLLATTTCLTPILLLAATPAAAQSTIDTKVTTPVKTSTANNGAPSDVTITTNGSVVLTGGTGVTLDSANNVTNNGKVTITDANNAIGIDVAAGGSGTITNAGTITIDETYTATDTDSDGDIDGPFANGTGRYGIRTTAPFTGSIVNSGTIAIEGNNSAAISVGGPLTGSLTSKGTITVLGNNSYGIHAGDVTGNVRVEGSVAAQGANAVGVAIDGNVGGSVVFQGTVTSTGYRYTTAPSDTSKLDADDLLQGGPAVRISGNVAGGILFDAPPVDSDSNNADEDNDGVADANEGTALIQTYGAAPAVQIGSATQDLTIGAVSGDTGNHGLVIKGGISGSGVYAGVDATGVQIGGMGHAVNLAGGIRVTGAVAASSLANATALRIGTGTSAPDLTVSGSITAQGGSAAGNQIRAVSIETGTNVTSLHNSGTIQSIASSLATSTAVYDATGNLTNIENSGYVLGRGGTGADNNGTIAFDLRANTSGVTLKQLVAASGANAPGISGNIMFGSGNDLLDVADGTVTGNAVFGAGNNSYALSGDAIHTGKVLFGAGNDALTLAGTSRVVGDVDFGGGGGSDTFTLASGTYFRGAVANGAGAAVTVNGTFDSTSTGSVALGSLNVGSTGVIGVNINGAGTSTRYDVAGAASFAAGSKLLVHLTNVSSSVGSFVVVDAGSLTGGDNLGVTGADLPFMFKSSVSSNATAGTVTLNIDRKSTSELGLNRSESAAYDSIYKVMDKDAQISGTFLAISDQPTFAQRVGQFLPEHAGGAFESVTQASRAGARFLADRLPSTNSGDWNVWLQEVAWGTSKSQGDTAAYDIGGWGSSFTGERRLGDLGWIGGSFAFYLGSDNDGTNDNTLQIGEYELGVHWRAQFGGLNLAARISAAKIDFDSQRRFDGTLDDTAFSRVSTGKWHGQLWSASGVASYAAKMGKRLTLRPIGTLDYYRLNEDAHTESGGGAAFDLTVDKRTSDELAATGLLNIGYELGSLDPANGWLRGEIEAGRRMIVGGNIGQTIARFAGEDPFVLRPADRKDGWVGRARLLGGQDRFSVGGEVGAEQQQESRADLSARLTVQMGW